MRSRKYGNGNLWNFQTTVKSRTDEDLDNVRCATRRKMLCLLTLPPSGHFSTHMDIIYIKLFISYFYRTIEEIFYCK